jgi:hypothetical protein
MMEQISDRLFDSFNRDNPMPMNTAIERMMIVCRFSSFLPVKKKDKNIIFLATQWEQG